MKFFKQLVATLLVATAFYFASVFIYHGWTTGARILLHRQPTIATYKTFPQREIAASAKPYPLPRRLRADFPKKLKFDYIGGTADVTLAELFSQTQTKAFIVVRNGEIIFEEYPGGGSRESVSASFSVTKSFVSALIGIAIAEGKIRSVDDAIVQYLPELKARGLDSVTIRHLLTMTSGIPYVADSDVFPLKSPFTDDASTFYGNDFHRLALELKSGSETAGKDFRYNDYNLILEGMILERATGLSVSQYLHDKIWEPAGMEFPALFSLDRADGTEKAHAGLAARPVDFARFGLLFLSDGKLNGRQIIPESWVTASTKPESADTKVWHSFPRWKEAGGYYALHWWGLKNRAGSYDYMARGNLGQTIYVSPAKKTVVVRFGQGPLPDRIWPFAIRTLVGIL